MNQPGFLGHSLRNLNGNHLKNENFIKVFFRAFNFEDRLAYQIFLPTALMQVDSDFTKRVFRSHTKIQWYLIKYLK